jgi:hypothetical protein
MPLWWTAALFTPDGFAQVSLALACAAGMNYKGVFVKIKSICRLRSEQGPGEA